MMSRAWMAAAIASGVMAYLCMVFMLTRLRAAGYETPSIWILGMPFFWSPAIYSFAPYFTYWNIAPMKRWSRLPIPAAFVLLCFTPYAFLHSIIVS
jgi:hypothetical protein